MLEINMEFRKGILFVRLIGELTKNTYKKVNDEITTLIKENGIRNVVFNIEQLEKIDMKGISFLYYNYELCNYNNGKILLCGLNDDKIKKRIKNSRLLNYMYEVSDELVAIKDFNEQEDLSAN